MTDHPDDCAELRARIHDTQQAARSSPHEAADAAARTDRGQSPPQGWATAGDQSARTEELRALVTLLECPRPDPRGPAGAVPRADAPDAAARPRADRLVGRAWNASRGPARARDRPGGAGHPGRLRAAPAGGPEPPIVGLPRRAREGSGAERTIARAPPAATDPTRTLLLRADNLLKNSPGGAGPDQQDDRAVRARKALVEAREVAAAGDVDERIRELVLRRLDALDALQESDEPGA